MKVLLACEESQACCIAFRERGHEAYSCDLEPCSGGHPEWHIQGDVFQAISIGGWDMMIAFPPCTYLCNAGLHYAKDPERRRKVFEAHDFFLSLYDAPIKKIAVENPVGYMSRVFRKPDQIINPYQFGNEARKQTCLWLRGLPRLKPTTPEAPPPEPLKTIIRKTGSKAGQKYNYHWREGKPAKTRSKTFSGIARAMSIQWSCDLTK